VREEGGVVVLGTGCPVGILTCRRYVGGDLRRSAKKGLVASGAPIDRYFSPVWVGLQGGASRQAPPGGSDGVDGTLRGPPA
jgi:hypothetical protein